MSFASETAKQPPARLLGITLLLGSLTMFGPISIDMYLPSMPAIAGDLGTNPAHVQWTLAAFLAGLATGQLFYGPLSDRIGRRPPLLGGIALYIAVSLGCAFAPSIETLIGLRFLQAVGASVGLVIARAVVVDIFPRQDAARMFSLLILVLGVAPIIAPLIGGQVLLVGSWRTIFFVFAGFGALLFVTSAIGLKETRPEATAIRARAESVARAYISVFLQRKILGYALAGSLAGASFFTFIAASPDLFIETYHVAPEHYGWIFGTLAVGFVACSQLNRHLLGRYRIYTLLRRGLFVAVAAAIALAFFAITDIGGLPALLVPLFVLLSSMGFVMPNGVAGAMAVDLERSGTTAAVVGSLQYVAGALAATVTGLMHDHTAVPMAMNVLALMVLGLVALLLLVGGPEPE